MVYITKQMLWYKDIDWLCILCLYASFSTKQHAKNGRYAKKNSQNTWYNGCTSQNITVYTNCFHLLYVILCWFKNNLCCNVCVDYYDNMHF